MFEHLLHGFVVALQPKTSSPPSSDVGRNPDRRRPGLGPTATLAMLIPLIFSMPPSTALILLTSVYYGSMYGGSTTSILVNIPGSRLGDHLPRREQDGAAGRAGPALAIAAIGSFIAGTFAVLA